MTMSKERMTARTQTGLTLVELMVALAIGSFLIIGAVQIYNQSRQAYVINDAIARVQETAQFAMDTIEADLRMASNWGRTSRADAIDGRSTGGNANPNSLAAVTNGCGVDWAYNLGTPIEGDNNGYTLTCAPPLVPTALAAQANSDTLTVRRGSVPVAPLDATRLQVVSTLNAGQLIDDGNLPAGFDPLRSRVHNLVVNSYYVADDSNLIPGTPALRRHTLGTFGGVPNATDVEIAPGVENLQVQFGVDVDRDNSVDRYVNPGDGIITPGAGTFIPGARILSARVWLVVRSINREIGIIDDTDYEPGDVDLGVQNDDFRRLMVSKTILLRNTRT